MDGYYTRKEAATILGVSTGTISEYVKKGLLKNIGSTKSILLPCEDIHYFYENNQHLSSVSRGDVITMEKKLQSLRAEVEILKLVMGIGSPRPERTDTQLLTLFTDNMKMLSINSWSTAEIYNTADLMIGIKDTEISRLLHLKGTRAWDALFDLADRMIEFIENNCDIPREAARMMCSRIEAGKNRMYGLLFVSIQTSLGLERDWAKKILMKRGKKGTVDEFIISYIRGRK